MDNNSFNKWLKEIKKLEIRIANKRTSDAIWLEKKFGDLDRLFEEDQCESLLNELSKANASTQASVNLYGAELIDGEDQEDAQSLHKALTLYLEYRNNNVLQHIKTMPDLIPEEHDGSYQLVHEAVVSLATVPEDLLDVVDLEFLYFMAVGTWKGGKKFRYERINKSHLSQYEKLKMTAIFDSVVERSKEGKYSNTMGEWSVGMFGTGFYSFAGKSDKQNARKFIRLCIDLLAETDETKALNMAKEVLKDGISGLQSAAASAMLHCFKPYVFPVMNSQTAETAALLEAEGVFLKKTKELQYYIDNVRKLKKFRDEKCQFRNYRALDIALWGVSKLEERDDEIIIDEGIGIAEPPAEEYYTTIDINVEKWKELLLNREVFLPKHVQLIMQMYQNGGGATATELAAMNQQHPSSFNKPVVQLARSIAETTGCHIPIRENGKKRWWHVPFNGEYTDDMHFRWILRDELKEAVRQIESTLLDEVESLKSQTKYWWLNANPKIWSFSEIEVGDSIDYTSKNENGNKRRVYSNFYAVKKGDIIIAYESNPVKAIVAMGRISHSHDGERIWVEKTESLVHQVNYEELSVNDALKDMEYFQNPHGSLFKLTLDEYTEIMDLIREENPLDKRIVPDPYSKEDFLDEVFMDEEQYDLICNLLKLKKNIILQGAPGVGKTYVAKRLVYSIMEEKDDARVEMIQFHQSYSYEDFMMGYRPMADGFKLTHGIFYRFCQQAQNDPDRPYYFIIDEINRGNISKIFGELMMLIEADKRGKRHAVPLTYTESKFYVPHNVHLIGTMNTADRSLAMLDYALRRRFSFIDIETAYMNKDFQGFLEMKNQELAGKIIERICELNLDIESDPSLGKGFQIGHSYFCVSEDILTEENYRQIIYFEIIPMLSEYWFDEPEKVKEWSKRLLG